MLTLVFFQYFEGQGWFIGEIAAYDGDLYRVIYEDGDSEEYDCQEMEDIVLTPNLEDVEVGSRVAVKRSAEDKFYEATVARVRVLRDGNNRRPLYLNYDDGYCGWLDLCQHKFRILHGGMHSSSKHIDAEDEACPRADDDSSNKDAGRHDKGAKESEICIVRRFEASPFHPVGGKKRRRIDQAEGDSRGKEVEDDFREANNQTKSEPKIANKLETSLFRVWNKRRRIKKSKSYSSSKGVADDGNDFNESEPGIASDLRKLGISSRLETSPFRIWNKRRRGNQAESGLRSEDVDGDDKANESELCASKLETSPLPAKRHRIVQAGSDACEVASLDIVFESESLPHRDEESVSFERECHSVNNENIKNVKKIKAASADVAELEEELPDKAAEMPEYDLLSHEEGHADASFNVEHELQKLHESIAMSEKDWDTDFMSVASGSWDLCENLLDDAHSQLSEVHEGTDPGMGEDKTANHLVSGATTPPPFPHFFNNTSLDDVGEGHLVSPTMESTIGNPGELVADETALPVFRCIPMQEPMLSMHLM